MYVLLINLINIVTQELRNSSKLYGNFIFLESLLKV